MDKKLDAFQLQQMLRAWGILIPSDEIVSLYSRVNKYYRTDNCATHFSIAQLHHYVEKTAGDGTTSDFAFRLIKILALDIDLWMKLLFVWAGVLLIILSFTTETLPVHIRRTMSMAVSTCYYINSGRYTIEYFFREWRKRTHSESCMIRFKEAMWKKSVEYSQLKVRRSQVKVEAGTIEIPREREENDLLGSGSKLCHQPTPAQFQTYIKEAIYDTTDRPTNSLLTRRDIEMLLLENLGSLYTSRVLDDIMSSLDKSKSGTVSPTEFHHFLATASKKHLGGGAGTCSSSVQPKHLLQGVCIVVWATITEPNWINTEYFFLGSALAFMSNFVTIFNRDLSFFLGKVPPYFIVMVLFIVGCNGFIRSEYEALGGDFHLKERAKDILFSHVRYSGHYNKKLEMRLDDDDNDEDYLDKESFARLLEESNAHMSEVKLDSLFCGIDAKGNGMLSKHDVESYLTTNDENKHQNKQLYILRCFMKSFSFWGNFTWLLGSYAYLISIFPPNQMAGRLGDIVGAFHYLIGGICLCGIIVEDRSASLRTMVKLNHALAGIIVEDNSSMDDETSSYDSQSLDSYV